MKSPVVIVGIGEIGSVFARGFLRMGHPVYPVTRDMSLAAAAEALTQPELVMIAVGENDLQPTLASIPEAWLDRLVLIQNELLPADWEKHDLPLEPTVVSVWFEKKKGQDVKVVVGSPVYGPKAELLSEAMQALEIPAYTVAEPDAMLRELVRKNYYILTSNIAGLKTGGSVGELWQNHRDVAQAVSRDVHSIQQHLTGQSLDHEALVTAMVSAFEGDMDHQCMGRSAPGRLQRALEIAEQAGLEVPALRAIQREM